MAWLWLAIGIAIGWWAARWAMRRAERPAVREAGRAVPREVPEPAAAPRLPDPRGPGPDPGDLPAGVPAVPATWLQLPLLAAGEPQEVVGESRYQEALLRVAGAKGPTGPAMRTVTAQLLFEEDRGHDRFAIAVFLGGYKIGYIPAEEAEELRDLLHEAGVANEPLSCRARLTGGWRRASGDEENLGVELDLAWPPRRSGPDDPFLPGGSSVEVDGVEAHAARLAEIARAEGSRLVATLVEAVDGGPKLLVYLQGGAVGALPPPETAAYLPVVRDVVAAGLPATCDAEIVPGPGSPRLELALAPAEELAGGAPPRRAAGT
jgi:hypothetical protein